jgi:hypothetical protein
MSGGGKTSTSTSSVQIPPEVMARYNSVNDFASKVAQTPYQRYQGEFVAPMTSTQNAAIANVNQAAGQAQPYFTGATESLLQGQQAATPYYGAAMDVYGGAYDLGAQLGQESYGTLKGAHSSAQPYNQAATGLALAGTQAVNPTELGQGEINKYMSPYLNSVVGATMQAMNQQNQEQQSNLTSDAIRSGAFGGDRSGVGAANLAYKQNLANQQTISGLYNTGYGQALATAQQQQGVGLGAQQANRAALQAGVGQMLGIGQQQFGQGTTTAAQLAGLGQQQFGQGLAAGQKISELGQGVYSMGEKTAQNLAALGTGAQNASLQGASAQLAAGTKEQETKQAQNNALYTQFLQEQGYPFQVAQFLASIAMGTGANSGSTTTTTQPTSFFSDKRLKENVHQVGETFDGQPIYRYNYKGQRGTQIGLIAQDVERKHPEAVGLAGGYKTVDYDRATEDAAHRGHFAYGGASMGGGVVPERAGEGFAEGGMPDYFAHILANARKGQIGAGLGGQGQGLNIPQGNMSPGRLAVASPPPAQASAGDDYRHFAENVKAGKTLIDAGTGLYKSIFGAAHGGAIRGYATDGRVNDDDDASPYGVRSFVPNEKLNIPALKTAQAGSGQSGGLGSDIMDAAKFASSIAGFASLFSDKRLKENVHQIGKTFDGQPVYRYNYKGHPETQIGLIAQDVERKHPEAVGVAGNYKTVDYGRATEDAAHRGHFAYGGIAPRHGYQAGGQPGEEGDDVNRLLRPEWRQRQYDRSEAEARAGLAPPPVRPSEVTPLGGSNNFDPMGNATGYGAARNPPGRFLNTTPPGVVNPDIDLSRGFWTGTPAAIPYTSDQEKPAPPAEAPPPGGVVGGRAIPEEAGAEASSRVTPAAAPQVAGGPPNMVSAENDRGYEAVNAPRAAVPRPAGVVPAPARPDAAPAQAGATDVAAPAPAGQGAQAGLGAAAAPSPAPEKPDEGSKGSWFSRNQDWLVPLLTGVGTMAASPSRYLGAALLQGIGGGAATYGQREFKERELNLTERQRNIAERTQDQNLLQMLLNRRLMYTQSQQGIPPELEQQISNLSKKVAGYTPPSSTNAPAPFPATGGAGRGSTYGGAGAQQQGLVQNPLSSAAGPAQFLDETWLDVMRNNPATRDLVANKSQQEILSMRANPDLNKSATEYYAQSNAPALRNRNIPVNDDTLRIAHGFGPAGAVKVIQSPNERMETLFPPDQRGNMNPVLAANPAYLGKTAGQVSELLLGRPVPQGWGPDAGGPSPNYANYVIARESGGARPAAPAVTPAVTPAAAPAEAASMVGFLSSRPEHNPAIAETFRANGVGQEAISNFQNNMPNIANDLPEVRDPRYLTKEGNRLADAGNPEAAQRKWQEASQALKDMYESGKYTSKDGIVKDIPGFFSNAAKALRVPRNAEFFERLANNQLAHGQGQGIVNSAANILSQFKTGAGALYRSKIDAAFKEIFPSSTLFSGAAGDYQSLAKKAQDTINQNLLGLDLKGGQTDYQRQSAGQATISPDADPVANRNVMAQMQAGLDYSSKYAKDAMAAAREADRNGQVFDRPNFTLDWEQRNTGLFNKLADEAAKKIAVRGVPIPNNPTPGTKTVFEPGWTDAGGNKHNSPAVFEWQTDSNTGRSGWLYVKTVGEK